MSLLAAIPAPTRDLTDDGPALKPVRAAHVTPRSAVKEPPPYGKRQGFVPRRLEDFGNGAPGAHRRGGAPGGRASPSRCLASRCLASRSLIRGRPAPAAGGAFPEIHVAQYPLDMGRPDKRAAAGGASGAGAGGGQTLALTVDGEGDINYDAVLKQGRNANKNIASTHKALIPKLDMLNDDVRPRPEQPGGTGSGYTLALRPCAFWGHASPPLALAPLPHCLHPPRPRAADVAPRRGGG
jgi:SNW domain-containing protein 1